MLFRRIERKILLAAFWVFAFLHSQGQSLPQRDVRVTSVYTSISDIILRRGERREGPETDEA